MSTIGTNRTQLHILVEIMHGLGDTVCSISLLKGIRHLYPEAHVTVLCKMGAGRDIVEASRVPVDDIIVIDVYKSIPHTLQVIHQLRRRHFDIGISLGNTPVKKSKLFMKLCGVDRHIGLQAEGIYTFDTDLHFVEANVKGLGIPYTDALKPQLYVDEQSAAAVKPYFAHLDPHRPIIGVCIGNADPSMTNRWLRTGRVYPRAWGIERIHELVGLLLQEAYQVVLIGGPQEVPLLEQLQDYVEREDVVNLVGRCSIKESMAAVTHCTCSVGIDTGMQHIAAALSVPTVSIFGPTNPYTHGAYSDVSHFVQHPMDCQYCFGTPNYIHCPHRACLRGITPQQVLDMVIQVIEGL